MVAYDEKCAGCRWWAEKVLVEGHHATPVCLATIGLAVEQDAWMRQSGGRCGPEARLFEPKEQP